MSSIKIIESCRVVAVQPLEGFRTKGVKVVFVSQAKERGNDIDRQRLFESHKAKLDGIQSHST